MYGGCGVEELQRECGHFSFTPAAVFNSDLTSLLFSILTATICLQ